MWSHLAFLQVGHLIFLPPSTNEVKWPSVKRGLLPEKPGGNWTRKGGKGQGGNRPNVTTLRAPSIVKHSAHREPGFQSMAARSAGARFY